MNLLVITYTYFYLLASPHATGIVDQIPPEELRRGLMLLSKVRGWLSRNIVGRSVSPSVRPSVRPSVSSQSHSQSLISPCCQPIGLSLSIHQLVNLVNQSINWSSSQSFSQSVNQSIINSVSQEVSCLPVGLSVSLSRASISRFFCQSIRLSNSPSFCSPVSQLTRPSVRLTGSFSELSDYDMILSSNCFLFMVSFSDSPKFSQPCPVYKGETHGTF